MANTALETALQFEKATGSSVTDGVNAVKSGYTDVSINDWAQAIHLAWLATITLDELISGLEAAGFSSTDAATEANVFFLLINIQVDTASVLAANLQPPYPQWINSYITMTSNHADQSSGQGGNELDNKFSSDDITDNQSILWTATSANGTDTVQLTEFRLSSGAAVDSQDLISTPVPVPGHTNQYKSNVLSNPPAGIKFAYNFILTINNDTSKTYSFDPWFED